MSMKFLIVDDSKTARMVLGKCLQMALKGKTVELVEAENGEDALSKLSDQKFDLIISDVNMPVMSGFTFLRNLKANTELSKIPIVFLTSLANDARSANLMEIGAYEVLKKPTSPKVLQELLTKLNFHQSDDSDDSSSGAWG